MTHSALVFVGLLAVSTSVLAQSPDIDMPLLAAPANLREGATVIKWKPDFTYETLKKGTNRLVATTDLDNLDSSRSLSSAPASPTWTGLRRI